MPDMPDHGWPGSVLAATVLAAAAYSVGRIVVGPLRVRRVHYDVDLTHALMGTSMAGMFVANLSFLGPAIWQAAFAVIIAWYATRAILGAQISYSSSQRGLLDQTGHLLSVAAMLYTLHATPSATTEATERANTASSTPMDMAMPSAGTVHANAHVPALALLFAALLLGYIVLVANRARQAIRAHVPPAIRHPLLAPRTGVACEVVMCAAMTIMLTTAL